MDITERLRRGDHLAMLSEVDHGLLADLHSLHGEAADEIDRLRAENARLKRDVEADFQRGWEHASEVGLWES